MLQYIINEVKLAHDYLLARLHLKYNFFFLPPTKMLYQQVGTHRPTRAFAGSCDLLQSPFA